MERRPEPPARRRPNQTLAALYARAAPLPPAPSQHPAAPVSALYRTVVKTTHIVAPRPRPTEAYPFIDSSASVADILQGGGYGSDTSGSGGRVQSQSSMMWATVGDEDEIGVPIPSSLRNVKGLLRRRRRSRERQWDASEPTDESLGGYNAGSSAVDVEGRGGPWFASLESPALGTGQQPGSASNAAGPRRRPPVLSSSSRRASKVANGSTAARVGNGSSVAGAPVLRAPASVSFRPEYAAGAASTQRMASSEGSAASRQSVGVQVSMTPTAAAGASAPVPAAEASAVPLASAPVLSAPSQPLVYDASKYTDAGGASSGVASPSHAAAATTSPSAMSMESAPPAPAVSAPVPVSAPASEPVSAPSAPATNQPAFQPVTDQTSAQASASAPPRPAPVAVPSALPAAVQYAAALPSPLSNGLTAREALAASAAAVAAEERTQLEALGISIPASAASVAAIRPRVESALPPLQLQIPTLSVPLQRTSLAASPAILAGGAVAPRASLSSAVGAGSSVPRPQQQQYQQQLQSLHRMLEVTSSGNNRVLPDVTISTLHGPDTGRSGGTGFSGLTGLSGLISPQMGVASASGPSLPQPQQPPQVFAYDRHYNVAAVGVASGGAVYPPPSAPALSPSAPAYYTGAAGGRYPDGKVSSAAAAPAAAAASMFTRPSTFPVVGLPIHTAARARRSRSAQRGSNNADVSDGAVLGFGLTDGLPIVDDGTGSKAAAAVSGSRSSGSEPLFGEKLQKWSGGLRAGLYTAASSSSTSSASPTSAAVKQQQQQGRPFTSSAALAGGSSWAPLAPIPGVDASLTHQVYTSMSSGRGSGTGVTGVDDRGRREGSRIINVSRGRAGASSSSSNMSRLDSRHFDHLPPPYKFDPLNASSSGSAPVPAEPVSAGGDAAAATVSTAYAAVSRYVAAAAAAVSSIPGVRLPQPPAASKLPSAEPTASNAPQQPAISPSSAQYAPTWPPINVPLGFTDSSPADVTAPGPHLGARARERARSRSASRSRDRRIREWPTVPTSTTSLDTAAAAASSPPALLPVSAPATATSARRAQSVIAAQVRRAKRAYAEAMRRAAAEEEERQQRTLMQQEQQAPRQHSGENAASSGPRHEGLALGSNSQEEEDGDEVEEEGEYFDSEEENRLALEATEGSRKLGTAPPDRGGVIRKGIAWSLPLTAASALRAGLPVDVIPGRDTRQPADSSAVEPSALDSRPPSPPTLALGALTLQRALPMLDVTVHVEGYRQSLPLAAGGGRALKAVSVGRKRGASGSKARRGGTTSAAAAEASSIAAGAEQSSSSAVLPPPPELALEAAGAIDALALTAAAEARYAMAAADEAEVEEEEEEEAVAADEEGDSTIAAEAHAAAAAAAYEAGRAEVFRSAGLQPPSAAAAAGGPA